MWPRGCCCGSSRAGSARASSASMACAGTIPASTARAPSCWPSSDQPSKRAAGRSFARHPSTRSLRSRLRVSTRLDNGARVPTFALAAPGKQPGALRAGEPMLLQIPVRVPDEHDPLGLLAASLRRHLSRLRAISYAGAHATDADEEIREQALAGLREALAFFERASDDPFREEADLLFPRVLSQAHDEPELTSAIAALAADRPRVAELHARVAEQARAL